MTFKNVLKKTKDAAQKVKEKVIEIDKKYPWIKYVLIAGGSYGIYRIGVHKGCKDTAKAEVEFVKKNYPKAYDIIVEKKVPGDRSFAKSIIAKNMTLEVPDNPVKQNFILNWKDNFQDNFEKIIEFAKDLDMKPCEALTIGYWVDPNSPDDQFRHYVQQQCGNAGYVKIPID